MEPYEKEENVMIKDLKAFYTRMEEDSAFAREAEAKGKSIAEAEKISDDKELAVRVGKELGYDFTINDINKAELKHAEFEAEKAAAGKKDMLDEVFELDPERLAEIAGGCEKGVAVDTFHPHDWVFKRREKGKLWGYNLVYQCRNCGDTKIEWEKWPWEDLFD